MLKIYRYTTNEYLEQWYKDDGKHSMVFQPVSKYTNIDNIRKDPLEGVAYYMPDETEITLNDMILPCRDFSVGMSVENFMIACFSTVYSKELCDRFQADCVLEGEIGHNIERWSFDVVNDTVRENLRFYPGRVCYKNKTVHNSEHFPRDAMFQQTLFTKCENYAMENEFRIVWDVPQSLLDSTKTRNSDKVGLNSVSLKLTPVKQWKLLPKL